MIRYYRLTQSDIFSDYNSQQMGRRVTIELSCDCCGKEYPPHKEYGSTGYIAHRNICEPYNMSCFVGRFQRATTDQERLCELLDHLNLETDDGHYITYDFIKSAFDCMVKALRWGYIENGEDDRGWKAYPEIADFLVAHEEVVTHAFNHIITQRINEVSTKMTDQIDELRRLLKTV